MSAGRAAARPTAAATRGAAAPACVASQRNGSAALADGAVTVSPMPGSRDASYLTQISLLGPPARELSVDSVTGSRAARTRGGCVAYSQGDGASFLPNAPFRPGEVVTVRARLQRGGPPVVLTWSFTVAEPVRNAGGSSETSSSSPPPAGAARASSTSSRGPTLAPPPVDVTSGRAASRRATCSSRPYSGPGRYGPMIVDGSGQLVWYKPLALGTRAADFRVQQLDGRPVLTWWQDPLVAGGSRVGGDRDRRQLPTGTS